MNIYLTKFALVIVATVAFIASAEADESMRSFPPDTRSYSRPAIPGDVKVLPTNGALLRSNGALVQGAAKPFVVDAVVNNSDPNLKNTDTFNDGEVSIAIDPLNTSRIVMTAFSGSWGAAAPLWLSMNGGLTWTKQFTINPPPGVPGSEFLGCPCDQTVDFGHFKSLAGTFLAGDNIYSARSGGLTSPIGTFNYFTSGGVAQKTTHLGRIGSEDQPWLLVGGGSYRIGGLRPVTAENVYVAYDDFNTAPNMRVAVATALDPLNFTADSISGFSTGFVNPGHRLAIDPRSKAVYSLFQRRINPGAGGSQNINYMLNRSTDYGRTWGLNGSKTGIVVANADSTQPTPKFCTVNALLGGADHAAVDPVTGEVVYVYGKRDPATGKNRLALRRLAPNAAGGLNIGPELFVTGQVQAAIPSVAITANRTIGVFYYTCDSIAGPFPTLTAHFSTSADHGASFADHVLETFLSPAVDNGNSRQRILGDYMQVKALGNTFFGGFTGNGVPFGRPFANNDPIFFKVSAP